MADDPKSAQKKSAPLDDDALIEGVEIELPPLFSREMLQDTRFLLILACAVVSGLFGLGVWLAGFESWALSVCLFTFNVLLISWFYFLVQHVRRQMEEEEANSDEDTGDGMRKSRKAVMSESAKADAEAEAAKKDASDS